MITTKEKQKALGLIDWCLNEGLSDRHDIYSYVVNQTGLARPVVRRLARELRLTYIARIKILQGENLLYKTKEMSKQV